MIKMVSNLINMEKASSNNIKKEQMQVEGRELQQSSNSIESGKILVG